MPLHVSGGCAAILDSERMFFAGGLTDVPQGEFIDFSLIYDKRTNQVEYEALDIIFRLYISL